MSCSAVYILLYMCVPFLVFCFYHFQIIVFIVGGGNYIEYQNLQDYSKVCTSCCDIYILLIVSLCDDLVWTDLTMYLHASLCYTCTSTVCMY